MIGMTEWTNQWKTILREWTQVIKWREGHKGQCNAMQCNGWMTCMKEQHGMNLCDSHEKTGN